MQINKKSARYKLKYPNATRSHNSDFCTRPEFVRKMFSSMRSFPFKPAAERKRIADDCGRREKLHLAKLTGKQKSWVRLCDDAGLLEFSFQQNVMKLGKKVLAVFS
jgi:hypothetical protein